MKLDHNSLSAKLYRWFYGTSKMPNNLCPYFWKLVISIVFGVPFGIFTVPHILVYYKDNSRDSISERIGVSAVYWIMIFCLISMLSVFGLFFVSPEKDSFYNNMIIGGIVLWIFAIVIGSYYLIQLLIEKWQNRHLERYTDENGKTWAHPKEKKSNILIEMIKAKYNRYCPKIDWNS